LVGSNIASRRALVRIDAPCPSMSVEGENSLPPLLFHVGEREVLRDDSVRFADKARAAGVNATVKLWPVWPAR
jgi:acetyl esterase/lipase